MAKYFTQPRRIGLILFDHPAHGLGTRGLKDLFELAEQGRPFLAFRQ
jgi:hypothetical protein